MLHVVRLLVSGFFWLDAEWGEGGSGSAPAVRVSVGVGEIGVKRELRAGEHGEHGEGRRGGQQRAAEGKGREVVARVPSARCRTR